MKLKDALNFAKGKSIDLIDGQKLEKMVADVRRGEGQFRSSTVSQAQSYQGNHLVNSTPSVQKICPSCGPDMMKRVARKGSHVGNQFWAVVHFRNAGLLRMFDDIWSLIRNKV